MAKIKVTIPCGGCGGTGVQPVRNAEAVECFLCEGSGEQVVGYIKKKDIGIEDLEAKLDQILEKLNE